MGGPPERVMMSCDKDDDGVARTAAMTYTAWCYDVVSKRVRKSEQKTPRTNKRKIKQNKRSSRSELVRRART